MIRGLRMAAENSAKRARVSGPALIGTHSGHFHADEALAVYMLRLLPTYEKSPLVRTRDPSVLKECHTVVDVGGEYNPDRNRFDHHQRDFNITFPGRNTKLSSAGLVFKDLGKSIIASQTGLQEESEDTNKLYEKIYDDFIEAFDANDNGISAYDTEQLENHGIQKRFNDRGFSIASVVSRFNYSHDLNASDKDDKKSEDQLQKEEDDRFLVASAFTGSQFIAELNDAYKSWLPAREIIKAQFDRRIEMVSKSGKILELPYRKEGLPWHDHLYKIEEEEGCPGEILYVVFPESGESGCKWRVRAVGKSREGFELRKPLPERWRGVRDNDLDQITGIPGCVFVHASGFIGGNISQEGATLMAKAAVDA